jgi:hypothetical protein
MVLCDIIRDNDKYNSHNPFEGDPCDVSVEDDEVVVATEEEEKTNEESDEEAADAERDLDSLGVPNVVDRRRHNEQTDDWSSDSSEPIARIVERLKKKTDDDADSLSSDSLEPIATAVQRLKKQKKK